MVIYLGGDRILEAPETGENVGCGTLSEFPGQTVAVRQITEPLGISRPVAWIAGGGGSGHVVCLSSEGSAWSRQSSTA